VSADPSSSPSPAPGSSESGGCLRAAAGIGCLALGGLTGLFLWGAAFIYEATYYENDATSEKILAVVAVASSVAVATLIFRSGRKPKPPE
jgi:hypothetical protein